MPRTVAEAVSAGAVVVSLRGVGEGVTSRCLLSVTNLSGEPMTLLVPRGAQFVAAARGAQTMVVTTETAIDLPAAAGGLTEVVLPTVCGSPFGYVTPPVDGGGSYLLLGQTSPLVGLFNTVAGLGRTYQVMADGIGMPVEQFMNTIAQYSTWALYGNPPDTWLPPTTGGATGPGQSGQTPTDRGQTPGDGGQTPADGGQTPADGGQTPTDSGQTPTDGGQTPNDSGQTPTDRGQTPTDGGQTPNDSGQTPGDGGQTPNDSGQTPADSGRTPGDGGQTPNDSGQTPADSGGTRGLSLPDAAGPVAFGLSTIIGILAPQLTGRGASEDQVKEIATTFWDGVDTTLKTFAAQAPVTLDAVVNPGLHTVEKPGTGTPDVKPMDPDEPRTTDDGTPAWVTDRHWRVLQMAMSQKADALVGDRTSAIRVSAGDPNYDAPDYYATMAGPDKVLVALQQAVTSGQVSAEVAAALDELLTPEGLAALAAFAAAFVAAELAGGPVAWFATASGVVMLYIALGQALIDLSNVLVNDVVAAKNKWHFDQAVAKVATALAGIGVIWLTTFATMVVSVFGTRAVRAIRGRGTAPAGGPAVGASAEEGGFGARGRNPELSKGGVRQLSPAAQTALEQQSYNAARAQAEAAARPANPQAGRKNCYNTARATDARLAGDSVSATAPERLPAGQRAIGRDGRPLNATPNSLEYFEQDYGTSAKSMGKSAQAEIDVANMLYDNGPGTRVIVLGDRAPITLPNGQKIPQLGHAFNGVNIDGHVFFVDGQSGRVITDWSRFGLDNVWIIRTN